MHCLRFTATAVAILLHVHVILTVPNMLVLWFAAIFAALHTEPI